MVNSTRVLLDPTLSILEAAGQADFLYTIEYLVGRFIELVDSIV